MLQDDSSWTYALKHGELLALFSFRSINLYLQFTKRLLDSLRIRNLVMRRALVRLRTPLPTSTTTGAQDEGVLSRGDYVSRTRTHQVHHARTLRWEEWRRHAQGGVSTRAWVHAVREALEAAIAGAAGGGPSAGGAPTAGAVAGPAAGGVEPVAGAVAGPAAGGIAGIGHAAAVGMAALRGPMARERVLFIGTQFSILYTSMYSQATVDALLPGYAAY
jgi:hypothetical protein